MQVFKAYFKIIQKNLPQMLIYIVVFIVLAVLFSRLASTTGVSSFQETKIKTAVICEDAGEPFAQALYDYIDEHSQIVEIGTTPDELMDALFFRNVEYILRIPKGYSQSFLNGDGSIVLEKTIVPDSATAVQVDFTISRFLSLAQLYHQALPALTATELARYVNENLANEAAVEINQTQKVQESENLFFYFKYFSYSLMAIMVLGVTSIMMVFGQKDLQRRNHASPIKNLHINLQLVLGNLVFALCTWALMALFGLLLYPRDFSAATTLPLLINSLVYTLVALAISLFCGNLVRSKNAQSAIANVLSLGLCFISGVFVSQELLGKTVQRIASFTPTYWYVSAIQEMRGGFTAKGINALLIQLGFAIALLSISLAISRYKSTSDQ